MSPVVYPLTAVPEPVRSLLELNPLAALIDGARDIVLFGRMFDWGPWSYALVLSLVMLQAGYAWFMATKKSFPELV